MAFNMIKDIKHLNWHKDNYKTIIKLIDYTSNLVKVSRKCHLKICCFGILSILN